MRTYCQVYCGDATQAYEPKHGGKDEKTFISLPVYAIRNEDNVLVSFTGKKTYASIKAAYKAAFKTELNGIDTYTMQRKIYVVEYYSRYFYVINFVLRSNLDIVQKSL